MSSPNTKNPVKRSGGPAFHKDPNCACSPCRARRRKAEALVESAGRGETGLIPSEAIEADFIHVERHGPRQRIAQWLELRTLEPNITNVEAAKRMGIARTHLQAIIGRAVREGWLVFDDPISNIEYEIIPKVIRNLNKFLDEGDKTVTVETAKGTIFKVYQDSKGVSEAAQTMLAIKIEPVADQEVKIVSGKIVGRPREIIELPIIEISDKET